MALATKTRKTDNQKAQITLDRRYKTLFLDIVKHQAGYSMASLVRDAFDYAQGKEKALIKFAETRDEIYETDFIKDSLYHSVAVGAEAWNEMTEWADHYFPDNPKYSLFTEMVFFYLLDHDLL